MNAAEKPVLKPANDNPWYWLATLYGDSRLNHDIELKNRFAWNRWFATALSTEQLKELLSKVFLEWDYRRGFSQWDIRPLNSTEAAELAIAFTARSGRKDQSLPNPNSEVDFSRTIFDSNVRLSEFLFPNGADFTSATFSKEADFSSAMFLEKANFESATFSGIAYFQSATFSGHANFKSVTFSSHIDFVNSEFTAKTIFANAHFNSEVPDFRGAKLHEATEWHDVRWPSAPRDKTSAQKQVYAYERLKQEMERLKKHEDELFFFRKELRARRELLPFWRAARWLDCLYKALSDYGQSASRPLYLLCGSFLLVSAVFAWVPCITGTSMTILHAASLSFASIFLIFPIHNEIMTPHVFSTLSSLGKIIVVVEAFFGTLLLFLLGVALRNRFRMR